MFSREQQQVAPQEWSRADILDRAERTLSVRS